MSKTKLQFTICVLPDGFDREMYQLLFPYSLLHHVHYIVSLLRPTRMSCCHICRLACLIVSLIMQKNKSNKIRNFVEGWA